MSYFPEYYGGEYWNRALTQVGQELGAGIAESMKFYRERHDQAMQMDKTIDDLRFIPGPDGGPMLDKKTYERLKAGNENQRFTNEKAWMAAMDIANKATDAHLKTQKLTAERNFLEGAPFITDPVTHTRMYKGQRGYVPIRTRPSDTENALNKYAASLGLTQDEFRQIDPTKIKMYDQFGKEVDPKNPLPAAYGIVTVNGKQARVAAKDLQRMTNLVGIAKQTPQERMGVAYQPPPKFGEIRKGYRYKSHDPSQWRNKDNWEKVVDAPSGE